MERALYCPDCGHLVADDRPQTFISPTKWEHAECDCGAVLDVTVDPGGNLVVRIKSTPQGGE